MATEDRFAPQPLPAIVEGAVPDPLVVPVQDADGAPRNIAGYTVEATIWRTGTNPTTKAGTVVTVDGTSDGMQVQWTAGDFDSPGTYRLVVWAVAPGLAVRIASPVYELQVLATGMTPPTP